MKRIFVAALLMAAGMAQAYPACLPKQLGGSGTAYKTGSNPDGVWIAWTCMIRGKKTIPVYAALLNYQIVQPSTRRMSYAEAIREYIDANVRKTNDPKITKLLKDGVKAVD